ncbi:MAG: universal stress protein [Actinomycetota bacterium]
MAYQKILIGTDGSPTATAALRDAAKLAKSQGANMVVLCVFDPPSAEKLRQQTASAPAEIAWRITGSAAAEEVVARAASVAREEGVEVTTRLEMGDPSDVLINVAEEEKCDLILLGNKGMAGVKRFLLGSVPNRVSHHAPCDVLIVKTT